MDIISIGKWGLLFLAIGAANYFLTDNLAQWLRKYLHVDGE